MSFLTQIDIDGFKRISQKRVIRSVKRQCIKDGYKYPFTFYGAYRIKGKEDPISVRIDILSSTPYTKQIIFYLYRFFYLWNDIQSYSIWVYNHVVGGLSIVYRRRRRNN